MSNWFFDSQFKSKNSRSDLISSLSYFLGIFLVILFLFSAMLFNILILHGKNSITELTLGWIITIIVFFILLHFYVHHYSYNQYITRSPQEWLSSYNLNLHFVPTKFQLVQGRRFLIDDKKFSFLVNKKEGYTFGLLFIFLISGLLLSFFPFISDTSPNIPKLMIVTYLLVPIIILFIIYFTILFLILRVKFFEWSFEKTFSDQINFFISNPAQDPVHDQTNKLNLMKIEIIEKQASEIYSHSKIFKRYKDDPKFFLLALDLPSFMQSNIDKNVTYYLTISDSKEYSELIKEVFLKWLNNRNSEN